MKQRMIVPVLAVGAVCALAGAAVTGVASSSAATKPASPSTATAPAGAPPDGFGHHGGPGGHGGGPGAGGIHSERVMPDPDGSGFVTVVEDSGTLSAIDGSTLALKEGTASETYKTLDVVADGTVTVRRNGTTAKLASLKVGDHVRISKDGTTTRIDASTAAWEQAQAAQRVDRAPSWPSA